MTQTETDEPSDKPAPAPHPDDMLTTKEASLLIGRTEGTMKVDRVYGRGPKFIKCGEGKASGVRYRRRDIEAWLAERTFSSTSEYSAAARQSRARTAPAMRIAPNQPITPAWLKSNV